MPKNLSSQAQNSRFQWKKASLGVGSPWFEQLKKNTLAWKKIIKKS